jgi:heterodisulfide reductase subunit A-like polyferredoxin
VISPKLVEVGRHLNIELLTTTELLSLDGEPGRFSARIRQEPRYIDTTKCTSCGECAKVCPIEVPNEYDKLLSNRRAAFKKYAQAIPGAYTITKRGTAPCKATCPAHVGIQGYIALIKPGQIQGSHRTVPGRAPVSRGLRTGLPPSLRKVCTRNDYDEPLAIRELHRFLADWEREQGEAPVAQTTAEKREEKIAVIGSGPAGLTAAAYLPKRGYAVTIFEKLPVVGGMMAVGIPEYRLPRDILAAEIKLI